MSHAPASPPRLARLVVAALATAALGACNLVIGVDDFEAAPTECASAADCAVPAAACLEASCVEGRCGEAPRSIGTACSVGAGTTCDGTGSCLKCLPQEKVPSDLNTGDGCGGPSCTKCPDGARCAADADCLGARCVAKVCSTLG